MKSFLAIFWMDFSAAKTFFSAAEKPEKERIFSVLRNLTGNNPERRQVNWNLNAGLCGLLSVKTNI